MLMKLPTLTAYMLVTLTPLASAATADQEQACMSDAFRLCSHAIPDRGKVYHCLKVRKRQLAPACKKAFEESNDRPRPDLLHKRKSPKAVASGL